MEYILSKGGQKDVNLDKETSITCQLFCSDPWKYKWPTSCNNENQEAQWKMGLGLNKKDHIMTDKGN